MGLEWFLKIYLICLRSKNIYAGKSLDVDAFGTYGIKDEKINIS